MFLITELRVYGRVLLIIIHYHFLIVPVEVNTISVGARQREMQAGRETRERMNQDKGGKPAEYSRALNHIKH